MKYLKRFQTNAEYQAFKGGDDWLLPNLSAVSDIKKAYFNPKTLLFTIINTVTTSGQFETVRCKFISGMTWEEWVNSEYNTINATVYNNQIGIYDTDGSIGLVSLTTTDTSAFIDITEKIIINKTYYINYWYCCFVEGSKILVDIDGTTKNIEDIKEGDIVISYSTERDENYESIVKVNHMNTKSTDMAKVTCADGTVLEMTAYHPLYTKEGWKSLTNHDGYPTLTENDVLKTIDDWSEIVSIERYRLDKPVTTYTLNVVDKNEEIDNDINDAFYVNGVLAHNGGSK